MFFVGKNHPNLILMSDKNLNLKLNYCNLEDKYNIHIYLVLYFLLPYKILISHNHLHYPKLDYLFGHQVQD